MTFIYNCKLSRCDTNLFTLSTNLQNTESRSQVVSNIDTPNIRSREITR